MTPAPPNPTAAVDPRHHADSPTQAPVDASDTDPVARLRAVRVWTPDGADLLHGIDWEILPGQHWALLGANGAGKSTLLSLLAAVRHPSAGEVEVLGGRLGRVDMPALRRRIGVVDPSLTLYNWLTVEDVILTGATGTVRPLWDRYGAQERERARELLTLVGCADLAHRGIATCSHGERQRVRIARALMPAPALLLLDEPAAGLDLPSRETLLGAIASLADRHPSLATVLVTHHVEELPTTTSHALLLRQGRIVAAGAIATALTERSVAACFGLPITLGHAAGRWSARAAVGDPQTNSAPARLP